MYESILTRFSAEHPCWTSELLVRAGEDADGLRSLEAQGLLKQDGGVYTLTEAGRKAFTEAAAEMYLNEDPAGTAINPEEALMTTELWLELERCNVQRWGIKRYLFDPPIGVRPALSRDELWGCKGNSLTWNYLSNLLFKKYMDAHSPLSISERKPEIRDPKALESWRALPSIPLFLDLLFLCDYDFENYLDFRGHPADRLKLINADRFAFSAASSLEDQLDLIGRYHLWLWEQRRLTIPGYLDSDTHEQDSVNWLIFFSRTQQEALATAERLKAFGSTLIEPANPMEIWTLSLEAIKGAPSHQQVVWDVLPALGQSVCRSLQR